MEDSVDSLKVTGFSFASMGVLFTDILPWVLGISVGVLQIIYLLYKIKKIRSE
jgi:hypothetical protein